MLRRRTETDVNICVCFSISSEVILMLSTQQQTAKSDQSIEA